KERLDPRTRMNLVTTNDIIGGNSGSPLVNAGGEIVGLVFDGNIHSLGGNYWYDERLNRTVAVHSSAILEALRKVYGADRLVRELESARR
ncbi:MAG TPA: S46 family peptidase, partial [Dokdonella sp.]|nr:S46 family peptidase [Dokdonella sp.]